MGSLRPIIELQRKMPSGRQILRRFPASSRNGSFSFIHVNDESHDAPPMLEEKFCLDDPVGRLHAVTDVIESRPLVRDEITRSKKKKKK